MKRSIMISSLVAIAVVVALSLFLATRKPVTGANQVNTALLGKTAPPSRGPSGRWRGTRPAPRPRPHRGREFLGVVVRALQDRSARPLDVRLAGAPPQRRGDRCRLQRSCERRRSFARYYGSLYPSVIDRGGEIAYRYGVTAPPTTFIINTKGIVAASLIGPVSTAQLEDAVARVRTSTS